MKDKRNKRLRWYDFLIAGVPTLALFGPILLRGIDISPYFVFSIVIFYGVLILILYFIRKYPKFLGDIEEVKRR